MSVDAAGLKTQLSQCGFYFADWEFYHGSRTIFFFFLYEYIRGKEVGEKLSSRAGETMKAREMGKHGMKVKIGGDTGEEDRWRGGEEVR